MNKLAFFRIFIIVKMAVVFFLQLTIFERCHRGNWTDETNIKWELLIKKQAAKYRQTALRLEGLLIKLGQFLSTRADVMPKAFLDELEDLIDRVPAVPWEEAQTVMEQEWNAPVESVAAEIDRQPVASASIGQVYKARLYTGELIAVKVQRPDIDRIIAVDFKAVRIVMKLAKRFTKFGKQTDMLALYREMTSVIGAELDFRRELENGLYFKKRYESFSDVDIPGYNRDYSTKKVLVMDWVEAARITDISFLERNGIDRQDLAVRLTNMFLEQLLQEGKFHADPHPGNILVKADGTIVLIDFGMTGRVPNEDAVHIRTLIEGILIEDYDQVIKGLEGLRFLLPHADKERMKRVIRAMIDAYTAQSFMQLDDFAIGQLLDEVQQIVKKEPVQLPAEFAFLGRAVSTFIGLLHILDPNIDLMEVGRKPVMDWLGKHAGKTSPKQILVQSLRPLLSFPQKFLSVLDEPRLFREQRDAQQKRNEAERDVLKGRRDALLFMAVTFPGVAAVPFVHHEAIVYGGPVLFMLSVFFYIRAIRAHKRFIA
ncbi:ABC1 kinase family protein [Domibacillus aminovorans]|uniref:ABC1 kinase family protein n=1 Tax=Domibacillus aminovorans TaxID=29332 RepID=UPI0007C644F0|nr:AarF/UbiB family protein [Domibacillus aminovorans]